jgi:hypothetical protein
MDKVKQFLKGTKAASRVLFILWIIFSALPNFAHESKLIELIDFAVVFLFPAIINELCKNPFFIENKSKFFIFMRNTKAPSRVLLQLWAITAWLGAGGGTENLMWSTLIMGVLFLLPAIIIERKKNPILTKIATSISEETEKSAKNDAIPVSLLELKKEKPQKRQQRKENHKKPLLSQVVGGTILCVLGGFLSCLLLMPIIALTDKEFYATAAGREGITVGIVMGVCGLILLTIGICYLQGKFVDSTLARKEQKAFERRMRPYKGVFLTEEQINNLKHKTELPIVNTPVFLRYGEVAVYHCQATRQEMKQCVVGRTGGYTGSTVRIAKGFSIHTGGSSSRPIYGDVSTQYSGEFVITTERIIFLSDQKGFELQHKNITAATAYRDGFSFQSKNTSYVLLMPCVDLATLAFDGVRTGEIPMASSRSGSAIAFADSTVDCSSPIYVDDELFVDAVDIVMETVQASVSMIQRTLHIGYGRAARLIDEMENHGIIGSFEGSRPRQIIITDYEWEEMRNNIIGGKDDYSEADTDKSECITTSSRIDGMDGHEFEHFCAELLRKNGFSDVKVTPGSGDQGVDILAEKGGVKYAIQCKNYASPLSNTPVQEVSAGKMFYNCHVGVVMTNSTFTPGAKTLAQATGVLLWDRSVVQNMMESENCKERRLVFSESEN